MHQVGAAGRVSVVAADGRTVGVIVVLHGGQQAGVVPVRRLQLAWLRMAEMHRFIGRTARRHGLDSAGGPGSVSLTFVVLASAPI